MLKSQNRLRKRKEFAYIYRKGEKFNSDNLILYKISSKYTTPRIGFSVSNKVGKAVIRNKIKRRLREIMRENIVKIQKCNLIIVAKPSITELNFSEIKTEIQQLLSKGKVYE